MHKYWQVFKIGYEHAIAYRGRTVIWVLHDLFFVFIMPFVWLMAEPGENQAMIVSYFIGVASLNNLVAAHLDEHVGLEIREGRFTNLFIKPISYFWAKVIHELAWRLNSTLIFLPIFIAVILFLPQYIFINHDTVRLILTFVALCFSFLLFAVFTLVVGLTAFFTEENKAISDFFWVLMMLFSGEFAPLAFFPDWLRVVAEIFPFRYLVSFPLEIYFNQINSGKIFLGFLNLFFWLILSLIIYRLFYQKGIKRYQAIGL